MFLSTEKSTPLQIVFDFSKYKEYVFQYSPTGISRVDVEYARFLSKHDQHLFAALHSRYGLSTRFQAKTLRQLVANVEHEWSQGSRVRIGEKVAAWLGGHSPSLRRVNVVANPRLDFIKKATVFGSSWPHHRVLKAVPEGAIYLNVSYSNLQSRFANAWLRNRPDLFGVYMIHDLLPLTRPELFWNGVDASFPVQIRAILDRADLIIVNSNGVRDSVVDLMNGQKRTVPAIEIIPLPPAPEFLCPQKPGDMLAEGGKLPPYFVICATIEPRKNHRFLLQVWERFVRAGGPVPKLVVIGHRGWKYEETVELLERSSILAGHVLEVTGLSPRDLPRLVRGARALLLPSEAEGYGMPIVEALSLGTPVIASDIPVFRDISQGCVTFLPLGDAEAWSKAIRNHAEADPTSSPYRSLAGRFRATTWEQYFATLLDLLRSARRPYLKEM